MFISHRTHLGTSLLNLNRALKLCGYVAGWLLLLAVAVWSQWGAFFAQRPAAASPGDSVSLPVAAASAQPTPTPTPVPVTTVSAASFEQTAIAPESIVAAFGAGLATRTASAPTIPLPTLLAGTQVTVKDKNNVGRPAPLFFVSPDQVNYLVPEGTAEGMATVTIRAEDGKVSTGVLEVRAVAPALFTANGDGKGVPAAVLVRVRANGVQVFEEIRQFDQSLNRFVPKPIELGAGGESLALVLYASGLRVPKEQVLVVLDGIPLNPSFVGPVPGFVGLDQINVGIPRVRVRRGPLSLWVQVENLVSSNITQIEIAFPQTAAAPRVTGFDASEVAAGQSLTISGANFSADPTENSVVFVDKQIGCAQAPPAAAKVISATDTELNVIVPYGAAKSQVSVRTIQGEGLSAAELPVRTSISGFVEDTQHKPIVGVIIRLRLSNNASCDRPNLCARTNAEGAFVLMGVPAGSARVFEVDGSTADPSFGRLPDPPKTPVLEHRDNYYCGFITLQRQNGTCAGTGCGSGVLAATVSAAQESSEANQTNNAVLDLPPGAVVRAPDGTTIDKLNVAVFENGRAPSPLPPGHFSSAIVQIMPLGASITPGAKLVLPNSDHLPAGAKAQLYRFDATQGRFVLVEGPADMVTVTAESIETAANAITETSYYFVSIDRPTTTLYGHVVESDGQRPVRRALVVTRGQYTFTDAAGGYQLRGVPVLSANDAVTIDVSVLRPDGRVDRADLRVNLPVSGGNPLIVMPKQRNNRPPVIIAPSSLNVRAGEVRDFNLIITDPDPDVADPNRAQALVVNFSGPDFATLTPSDNAVHRLNLRPGANEADDYTLTITARDSLGVTTTQKLALKVNNPAGLTAHDQAVTTDEDVAKAITLTASNAGGASLSYEIIRLPKRGRLSVEAPNVTYTPDKDYNGLDRVDRVDSFTFRVKSGTTESNVATVFIAVSPVNDVPVLIPLEPLIVSAGQTLNLRVSASDVDIEQSLTFLPPTVILPSGATSTLPSGATFAESGATSRQLSWTPTFAQAGEHTLQFKVEDDGYPSLSASRTVTITVVAKLAQTSAIEGGYIRSLLNHAGYIFAAVEGGGVFRSANQGQTWERVNQGLSNLDAQALVVSDNTIFLGTLEGLFRSTDLGRSWASVEIGLGKPKITALAAKDPMIFAVVDNRRIFRKSDQGATWTDLNARFTSKPITAILVTRSVTSTVIYVGTYDADRMDGEGVFRSFDQGQSWDAVNTGFNDLRILSLAQSGNNIFAGTRHNGIYRLSNQGQRWESVRAGAEIFSLAATDSQIYAGSYNEVYRSSNQGGDWDTLREGVSNKFVHALLVNDNLVLAGTDGGGVLKLFSDGRSWRESNTGLNSARVLAMATRDANVFAGTRGGGVFRSADNGQSWTPVNNGLDSRDVFILVSVENGLYAGTIGGGVSRWIDQEQKWVPVGNRSNGLDEPNIDSLAVSGLDLYAGGYDRILYRSTDGGASWKEANEGFPDLPGLSIFYLAVADNTVLAATSSEGVYRSTDKGLSWAPTRGLTTRANREVRSLAVKPSVIFAGTGDGVYRSFDNGRNWEQANVGIEGVKIDALLIDGTTIFAGTLGKGLYFSNNDGQTWRKVDADLHPFQDVFAITASGPRIFAGTNSGVFLLTNNFQNWTESNSGLSNKFTNSLVASGDNLFVGTLGSGVFRSTDQGRSWRQSPGLPLNASVQSLVTSADGASVFAGTSTDGVFRFDLDNQAQSWVKTSGNPSDKPINALAVSGSYLFAATDGGGVFRSNVDGQSWTPLPGLPSRYVLTLAVNGRALYAGTDGDGVFVSTNDGDMWAPLNGLTARDVRALAFSGRYIWAGTLSGGVFRWDNNEQRWAPINKDLPLRLPVFALAVSGGKLVAGTIYGVFVSEDDGANWKQVNAGLLDVFVTSLAVSGNNLIAGTRAGGIFISQF